MNLKSKNTYELIEDVDNALYYLYTHNKNYTKKQYERILDLQDFFEELKERL